MSLIFKRILDRSEKRKLMRHSIDSTGTMLKPVSCSQDQMDRDECPCSYTDPIIIICENMTSTTSIPNTLLSSVLKIRMRNNSISSIDNVLWPRSLNLLALVDNQITSIGPAAFKLAPNLSRVYLGNNNISYIDSEAFAGLARLHTLQLESNKLQTFDTRLLLDMPTLHRLYLDGNMIDLPETTRFSLGRDIRELSLDKNRISVIRSHWFSNMSSLYWLSLAHNEISVIENGSFDWNYELEELDLSYNRITVISRQTFASRLNVQLLNLAYNKMKTLPKDAFSETAQLTSLNLTGVELNYIQPGTYFPPLLSFVSFSEFRFCHHAPTVRVCRPSTDGLSDAKNLLAFPGLEYAVWIVASVCCVGNVLVFIWRSVSIHEDKTLSLFVRNLSVADLMMGIYLCAIGYQNSHTRNEFGEKAFEWMSSWKCAAIGFIATLSSELSVFILTIITIERYMSIMLLSGCEEAQQRRRAPKLMLLAWIGAILIAGYPLIGLLECDSELGSEECTSSKK